VFDPLRERAHKRALELSAEASREGRFEREPAPTGTEVPR
jgi:hypothetical protein